MPDEQVITKTEEKPLLEEIRNKSYYDILKEQREAATKPLEEKSEEPTEEQKKKEEEERLTKEADEAKKKVEEEEQARKRDEEIARKAADDVIAKQKAEEEEKKRLALEEEEAKKRAEELKPKFTGKDKDGNVVPASYEELTAESVRIAKLQAKQETLAELEAKEKEKQQEQERIQKAEEDRKAQQKSFEDQLQKELDDDLKELYAANKLPKVKDPNDPNDIGNKEFKNLFETAQKVNAERMAKGEPPIRSIKLIFYEHYKPLGQLPGHDAPVLGGESTISHELPEDKYIPSRDRNKTMTQLIKEEAARMQKKLNIRGN